MIRRFIALVGLCVASSGAWAQVTLGQTSLSNFGTCPGGYLEAQETTNGPSYTVPAAGTITSWSFSAGDGVNSEALVILRPTSGSTFSVVAITQTQTVPAGTTGTFTSNIPVQAGDRIAEWSASNTVCVNFGSSGNSVSYVNTSGTPTVGASYTLGNPNSPVLLNMQATFVATQSNPVPALSEWGILILGLTLALSAGVYLRRKRD